MQNEIKIWVYADWDFLEEAQLMGWLTAQCFGWACL